MKNCGQKSFKRRGAFALALLMLLPGCQSKPEPEEPISSAVESAEPQATEEKRIFSLERDEIADIVFKNTTFGLSAAASEEDIQEILQKLNDFRSVRQMEDPYKEETGGGFCMRVDLKKLKDVPGVFNEYFFLEFAPSSSAVLYEGVYYYSEDKNYFSKEWVQKWEDKLPTIEEARADPSVNYE